MVTNTIQYTGEQARSFADISPEAWRHWRKVVGYLGQKSGKQARFSAGELVALAVLAGALRQLHIGIAGLAGRWDELFELCSHQQPTALMGRVVVITVDSVMISDPSKARYDLPTVVIPCGPIVERLSAATLAGAPDQTQIPLPFPPQAIAGMKS